MEMSEFSTEWALLFPLKAGLFPIKSSISSKTIHHQQRKKIHIRRGSSLSELDKLQSKLVLPDVVRSTERSYDLIPHSSTLLSTEFRLSTDHMCNSIGDMMNLKRFGGSNWSVRSETLVARIVPLSTVTSKASFSVTNSIENVGYKTSDYRRQMNCEPPLENILTSAQRTLRLCKLIRKQQKMQIFFPTTIKEDIVSETAYSNIYIAYEIIESNLPELSKNE